MINIRLGLPVVIVARHEDFDASGWVDAKIGDSEYRSVHVSELKADGGAEEIRNAAMRAPERPVTERERKHDRKRSRRGVAS